MSDRDCRIMELYCLECARLEPQNRGNWISQAERWHELGRARDIWRNHQKSRQQSMHTAPMAQQRQQS